MKILIIDDSSIDRRVIRQLLSRLGHLVVEASSGHHALEIFFQEDPDLVFVDVGMEDMDGFETVQRLRQMDDGWRPMIFISANTDNESFVRGLEEAGADDYLCKPVDGAVLRAKLVAIQRIMEMRMELLETTSELKIITEQAVMRADQDGLTGIANRRYLDRMLEAELGRAIREQTSLGILMIDIDHFKEFNDRWGHLVGDDALRQVATVLSNHLHRPADFIGRYGGEEFCVVLPNTSMSGAMKVAEKLRKIVEVMPQEQAESLTITISIGVTSQVPKPSHSVKTLIQQADGALYRAKEDGRNRVSCYVADGEKLSVVE